MMNESSQASPSGFRKYKPRKISLSFGVPSENSQIHQEKHENISELKKGIVDVVEGQKDKIEIEGDFEDSRELKSVLKNGELISFSQFPSLKAGVYTVSVISQINQDVLEPISEPSEQGNEIYVPKSNTIIRSQKMISHNQISSEYCQKNGSQDFISRNNLEIFEIIEFKDMDKIQFIQNFKDFAQKSQLRYENVDDNKIIVKGEYLGNKKNKVLMKIKNIFHFCLPGKTDQPEIYQLKTYLNNPKKVKLLFISGNPQHFHQFKSSLAQHLWSQNKLKCSPKQQAQYFLNKYNGMLSDIDTLCSNFIKSKQKLIFSENCGQNHEITSIMKKICCEEASIKNDMIKDRGLVPSFERMLITEYYQQLNLQKVITKLITSNRIEIFQKKKQNIKDNNSVRQIFYLLNLKQLYKKIQTSSKSQLEFKQSFVEFPFLKSISTLESLKSSKKSSPYQLLELISKYLIELHHSYNEYFKDAVKGKTEIEELELGVYCLVMCDNSEVWPTIRLLRQWVDEQMAGYTKQIEGLRKLQKGIFWINDLGGERA